MGSAVSKAIKWFLFIGFVIAAVASFSAAQYYGIKPVMGGVMAVGGAYMMGGAWRSLPKIPMISSVVLVAALAVLATFVPYLYYVELGKTLQVNYFLIWAALVACAGIPFMIFILLCYDD